VLSRVTKKGSENGTFKFVPFSMYKKAIKEGIDK
jgi:hypothetical protein